MLEVDSALNGNGGDYDMAIAESTDSVVGVAIDGPTGVDGVSTVTCCWC